MPPPPPPPPPPKMTAPPQAPPVAGPSTQTRPLPAVPPCAAPETRPPQDPSQMEGLYRLPTPVSADSDSHPFGVVPGWNPQLPTYLVENWSREVAGQVTKPPHGAIGKVERTAEPQPPSESEEEVPRPRKPIVKKKFGKKEKLSQPLYWLHQDEQPLPPHLPGQETSVDNHGRQLPCPNLFREYLLPDEQRSFSVSARPKSVLAPSHLLLPFGLKPRSDIKCKQKSDSHPKVKLPQHLPVYGKGPLFQQGHLLAELQAPLLEGYAPPDWVRPPCGSCAASGIKCTGGDFLHGVRCNNCNDQKKPCGFDLSIPRMMSLSALSATADAAPERISSLIVDSLMLRGMTRVAFALAEDQYKLLEAKMGTLSLILSRVYSDEGDAGLRRYFHDIEALQSLLEFSWHVPLDTPMLYPRRASTSTMGITQEEYTWTTTFDEEEVDEYLSSLRKDLHRKSSPPEEWSSEVAKGSNPPTKPAEVTPSPVPGRVDLLFGSPREPSPLLPKKRRRVIIELSEDLSAEQAENAGSGIQTPPPASPPAGQSRLLSSLPPPHPINPLIGAASRYPAPPPNLSTKEKRQWRKLVKRSEEPRKKRRMD
ncbi:hypothetical protein EST38_g11831 [Candolleomyces aberdarensis]|uniref:Zn(2)-C6 fungal-type domain-containing protein n=1 Tax=Candolleomyces aberdarensis TaxID=2316362 RepID=A0A4Q2D3Y1_9AGAR|nr:hypothetical protein EST38_g11831 [Candolleomyces aberdarensis]